MKINLTELDALADHEDFTNAVQSYQAAWDDLMRAWAEALQAITERSSNDQASDH